MNASDRDGRLVDAVAQLSEALAADFDVIDVLQTLADGCASALDVDAAGVLLADEPGGELDLVVSTDESTRIVETMQLSVVEGPCIDAYRESREVSVPDIGTLPDRYAAFRDTAVGEGFGSVYAIPMRLHSSTIGAVNLFRAEVGELDGTDRRAARALTDITTVGILQERSLRASEALQRQLQRALDSRVVIEQAKGVLAHMHDLTMEEAFQRLRDHARSERTSLTDVARALVDRTLII